MSNPRSFATALVRAWRSFMRRPAFFLIAVSSLAIALGLATTVIAQIDSLMHPYSPIKHVDRTYSISVYGLGVTGWPSREDVTMSLEQTNSFEAFVRVGNGRGQLEIDGGTIDANFFRMGREALDMLSVTPMLGRLFAPGETDQTGVAIVGVSFWRRHFSGEPTPGSAQFVLAGRTYRVVGVVDRVWERTFGGLWLPGDVGELRRGSYGEYFARVKPGVSAANLDVQLRAITDRWVGIYGAGRPRFRAGSRSLVPNPLKIQEFHRAMIGAAVFILIIASANVSALMLARGVTNRRGQALRLALGAGRVDLLRDVAAEVTILAVISGVAGVSIAYGAMGIMTAVTPIELSSFGFTEPNWNPRVFAAMFGAVVASIALASVVPALHVTRIAPAEPLKDASGTTTGRPGKRFQALVVAELALAMVLVFGAALIAKTAHTVATYGFGYDASRVTRVSPNVMVVQQLSALPRDSLTRFRWPEMTWGDLDAMVERLRAMPGAADAAWYVRDRAERSTVVSDLPAPRDSAFFVLQPDLFNTGPGFLRTVGIPIVAGRDFLEGDRAGDAAVILDQNSAERLFPRTNAIGRSVKLGHAQSSAPWLRVVGIARNAVHELPEVAEADVPLVIYVSRQRDRVAWPGFAVRSATEKGDLAPAARRLTMSFAPPGTYVGAEEWASGFKALLSGRRFTAGIFITLSLASLALATAGLFGVLSYSVYQRMREFSVRVALGAQRRDLLRLVFRDGLVMALGGTAIGAFAGMWGGFVVYEWLWGVYPVDPTALIAAEVVLIAITMLASAVPASAAARANPVDVMRAT